jgi:hypothetical protein
VDRSFGVRDGRGRRSLRYTLPYERNVTLVNFTSRHNDIYFRNNRIINEGIGVDVIQRITRRQVPRYRIQDIRQPGPARVAGGDVQVYRPAFRPNDAARPKVFLNRDQARRELAPARVFEPRPQQPAGAQQSAVRKRQAEEKNLLKQTQSQEMKDMQKRRAAEQAQAANAAQREKIKKDYQAKMTELQRQHQAEKQKLAERHQQDTKQVKQSAKPAKKKKAG